MIQLSTYQHSIAVKIPLPNKWQTFAVTMIKNVYSTNFTLSNLLYF